MKEFIILTSTGGIKIYGEDIFDALRTYLLMFDNDVIGIVDFKELVKGKSIENLMSPFGLS